MALSKSVTAIISGITVGSGASSSLAGCTEIDTDTTVMLAIEAAVTYNANASSGEYAVVKVYASGDGINYGDSPVDEFIMPFSAGSAQRWSRSVIPAERYMKVIVDNTRGTYDLTGVSVWSHAQTV